MYHGKTVRDFFDDEADASDADAASPLETLDLRPSDDDFIDNSSDDVNELQRCARLRRQRRFLFEDSDDDGKVSEDAQARLPPQRKDDDAIASQSLARPPRLRRSTNIKETPTVNPVQALALEQGFSVSARMSSLSAAQPAAAWRARVARETASPSRSLSDGSDVSVSEPSEKSQCTSERRTASRSSAAPRQKAKKTRRGRRQRRAPTASQPSAGQTPLASAPQRPRGAQPCVYGKHFLFTFPNRREAERVLLPQLILWSKEIVDPFYQAAIAACEDHEDGTPHFHAYVQATQKVRVYLHKVIFYGQHGNVVSGWSKRTDWLQKYAKKGGVFIEDGICAEHILEARQNHKSVVYQKILDDGGVRSEHYRQHPELLERGAQLGDAVDFYKKLVAQETFFESYSPPAQWFQWQVNLLTNLTENEPSRSSPFWFVDSLGGCGKSEVTTFLTVFCGACTFNTMSARDIVFCYQCEPIVILDFPRGQDIGGRDIYKCIEGFLDGRQFNTKYRSQVVYFKRPHVIIFSNSPPIEEFLSNRRWDRLTHLTTNDGNGHVAEQMVPVPYDTWPLRHKFGKSSRDDARLAHCIMPDDIPGVESIEAINNPTPETSSSIAEPVSD